MHLTRERLQEFATGRLTEDEAADVQSHLEQCAECGRLFDELDLSGDALIKLLREGHSGDEVDSLATVAAGTTDGPDSATWRRAPFCAAECVPGAAFGRYRIERLLGRGGMGVVYEAHDPILNRTVALKIIDPHRVWREDNRGRFRGEAEAAARLQHANIVQVFEFGEEGGTLFCAFELVAGGTLAQRLHDAAMAFREAAQLVAILADAAQYAHQRQVIHRDLKPANILFTTNGTPKIADFGLAKRLDDTSAHTLDGTVLGTPSYMAPEQAYGHLAAIGPRTDVYALGAVLYESLTGRPPFQTPDGLATVEQVKHEAPASPAQLRKDLPRDLETICLKCLEKSPADRYGSAAELAADLRRFVDGVPILARPVSLLERTAKLCRRHPLTAGLATVFAVLLLAFVVVVMVYNAQLRNTNVLLTTALSERGKALDEKSLALDHARREVYATQLQRAAGWISTNPEQSRRLLFDDEKCRREFRDFAWAQLVASTRRLLSEWDNGGEVRALAVTPDRQAFVTGDERGTLRLWSLSQEHSVRERLGAHEGAITDMAFSPGRDQLATCGEDGTTRLWPAVAFDTPLHVLPTIEGRVNSVAYAPDGKHLATAHSDGMLRVWLLPDVTLEAELPGHAPDPDVEALLSTEQLSILRISFSADSRYLASGNRGGELHVWTVADWQPLPVGDGFCTDVRFHPVIPECLAVASSYSVELKSIAPDGQIVTTRILREFADKIGGLAFSEDGSLLAAASYDGTTCAMDLEASDMITLEEPGRKNANVVFMDAQRLLTGTLDGRIQLWNLRCSTEPMLIDAHAGRSVTGLAFTLDSRMLLSSGSDGSVRVWDIASGAQCDQWFQPDLSVLGLASVTNSQCLAWEAGGVTYLGSCTPTGKLRHATIPIQSLLSSALAISPAGNQLAIVDYTGLRVLDTHTGEDRMCWSNESVTCVSFHPSRPAIVAGSDTGQVWQGDLATGQFTQLFRIESPVCCLAFSADGEQLGIGCADGDAIIARYHQPRERISLRGHAQAVRCLAFTPDSMVLATGGSEGDVRLWDPVVGAERSVLRTPSGPISLAFSPDSRELAAGGNDGVIRIWKTDREPALEDAVAATGASSGSGR